MRDRAGGLAAAETPLGHTVWPVINRSPLVAEALQPISFRAAGRKAALQATMRPHASGLGNNLVLDGAELVDLAAATPKQRRAVAPSAAYEDHRVRSGAARSEQTRRKLLVAALAVFAEKGTDTPVIEDFIAAAAVARGTFYNYFNTTQALLSAVTAELVDEILFRVDIEARKIDDPVERVVCGSLLYMHIAVDYPAWGGFMLRAGLRGDAVGKLVDVYLPRDLQMASDAGKARFPSVRTARDLVVGCVMQSIASVLSGRGAPQPSARHVYPRAAGNWHRARAGQEIVRDGSATDRDPDRLRSCGPSRRASDRARQVHQILDLEGVCGRCFADSGREVS